MRLIDADKLKGQFSETGAYTCKGIREIIDNAPTVDTTSTLICKKCGRFAKMGYLKKKGDV